MSVPSLLVRPFAPPPCADAPSIVSISKTTDTLGACFNGHWYLKWTLNISGTLQAGQEYYWELATDSAGTSWSFWTRGTAEFQENTDNNIGSDGAGDSTTRYFRARAYVVPTGESPPNECNGPTTGAQASRTADACFA